MDWLLRSILGAYIRHGTFRLTTARGTTFIFGDGTGKPLAVRIATRSAEFAILLDPELGLGECYMNGSFVVEQGTLAEVLEFLLAQNRSG